MLNFSPLYRVKHIEEKNGITNINCSNFDKSKAMEWNFEVTENLARNKEVLLL